MHREAAPATLKARKPGKCPWLSQLESRQDSGDPTYGQQAKPFTVEKRKEQPPPPTTSLIPLV